jgi:hypothetical protein
MLLALPLLALAAPALADEPDAPVEAVEPAPTAAPKTRKFLMEVGFRGRYMDLPDVFMDIPYFKNDDDANVPDRPHVSAYSLGIEFVVRDDKANGIFYVEYLNPLIEAGYWDDREGSGDEDHLDGSWIEPDKFGLVLIGANYAYEIRANNWFSFLFGAGVGAGIKIGNLNEWRFGDPEDVTVDCGGQDTTGQASYERKNDCDPDGHLAGVPPAIPYLDINLGPRFNIADHASIRVEGGIHMFLPYGGATLGIVF